MNSCVVFLVRERPFAVLELVNYFLCGFHHFICNFSPVPRNFLRGTGLKNHRDELWLNLDFNLLESALQKLGSPNVSYPCMQQDRNFMTKCRNEFRQNRSPL